MSLNNEDYEKIARLAFANSVELRKEAQLLFDNGFYARSAGLAIYSIEEQTKAITCMTVAIGKLKPEELEWKKEKGGRPRYFLLFHTGKHVIFGFTNATRAALEEYRDRILAGDLVDTKALGDLILSKTQETRDFFNNMEDERQNAFYVGVEKDEPILSPSEQFNQAKARIFLSYASGILSTWAFVFDNPKEKWLPFVDAWMSSEVSDSATTRKETPEA